jgi:hypothetical protein
LRKDGSGKSKKQKQTDKFFHKFWNG